MESGQIYSSFNVYQEPSVGENHYQSFAVVKNAR